MSGAWRRAGLGRRAHAIYLRSGLRPARLGLRHLRLRLTGLRLRLTGSTVVNQRRVRLHVDAGDARARRLAVAKGALSSPVITVWRKLVDELQPDLVIDIGANYGEVAYSVGYPVGAELHLVEANPSIVALLRRTAAGAGGAVHHCAASDRGGTLGLGVRTGESGLSSVHDQHPGCTVVEVPAARIDSVIAPGRRLLVKIDVEGHALPALRGLRLLLDAADDWAVVCELWNHDAADAGWLCEQFRVELIDVSGSSTERTSASRLRNHLQATGTTHLGDVLLRPKPSVGAGGPVSGPATGR